MYTKTFANVPFPFTITDSSNARPRCASAHAGSLLISMALRAGLLPVNAIEPLITPAVRGSALKYTGAALSALFSPDFFGPGEEHAVTIAAAPKTAIICNLLIAVAPIPFAAEDRNQVAHLPSVTRETPPDRHALGPTGEWL